MKFFKSQITKIKSQINPKFQISIRLRRTQSTMNQIDSTIFDRQNSAYLGPELIFASLRHELRPNVARVEGWSRVNTCLDHWSLGFGYCLLFGAWNFLRLLTQLYLDLHLGLFTLFVQVQYKYCP